MAYFSDENLVTMCAAYDEVCAFFPEQWAEAREDVARFIVLLAEVGEFDIVRIKERVLGCLGGELSHEIH